ncbi:ferritin-like protein [Streptomyces sp. CT34]|uniref:ferritin-like domain-containing protein n=1 Tax=Streptomyces sp. CT34 TaxID=1553907 RepID=UPI00099BE79D|nr:ferritin-like protein [Streptomyces sp. CT34]
MTDVGEGPETPPGTRFKRRSFLASAAIAAATPVSAASAAQATELPAVGRPTAPDRGSVGRLLAVPEEARGETWIRSALQVAVELELATIPTYLCAWWSIKDRRSEAARLIRRVIGDEMYHLGVVSNLLVAVGGRPRISDAAPVYPGPLPGGVRAGVTVYLSSLTPSFVHDVMMAIEAPEAPIAQGAANSLSIGVFYEELQRAFRTAAPELSTRGQLFKYIGADVLKPVENLDDVERSMEIVKEQGEGTASSPANTFEDDHPAHYYAFSEIYHGRRLRKVNDRWEFTGAPVPFPDVRPMARVPAGGWPHPPTDVQRLLQRFDDTYHDVLNSLDRAWDGGGERALSAAVHAMWGLESPAVELMEISIPDAPGTYGPLFRPLPPHRAI